MSEGMAGAKALWWEASGAGAVRVGRVVGQEVQEATGQMCRLYPEVGGGPGRVFHRRKAYDRCEQPSSGCPLADVKADHRSEGGARDL